MARFFPPVSFKDCLPKINLPDKSQHCTTDDSFWKNNKTSFTGKNSTWEFSNFHLWCSFLLASYWVHCTNLQYVKAGKIMNKLFWNFLRIMWLTKKLWKCQCFLNFAIIRGGSKEKELKNNLEQRQRERGEREEGREGRTRYLQLHLQFILDKCGNKWETICLLPRTVNIKITFHAAKTARKYY